MDTQLRCQQNYEKVTIKDFSSLLELIEHVLEIQSGRNTVIIWGNVLACMVTETLDAEAVISVIGMTHLW